MKAKLMALMLAVGLGVTGVAVTAQAAEEVIGCTHLRIVEICEFDHADYTNALYHHSTYNIILLCADCLIPRGRSTITKNEAHDYEQIFLSNGKVMLYCSACHDSYYQ